MLSTLTRTVIIYITVTLAIRLMGKRQIGDMQPNELVVTLLISEIAAIPLQDSNQPVINGIVAISALIIIEILLSALAMKSNLVRRIISGRAVILIKDGVIDQKAMSRVRITADDLLEMLRGKDIFDLNEVEFAILEVNGELNVFQKEEYKGVTKKDMKVKMSGEEPFLPLVIDGKPVNDYYPCLGISEEQARKKAERSGGVKDVFLLLSDKKGRQIRIKREEKG